MTLLSADQTQNIVGDIIYAKTQRGEVGFDLTVDSIHRLTGQGALDFGGSEFESAPTEEIEPELERPGDDYGWWDLDAGSYIVRYNESVELDDGEVALIYPHRRLLVAGLHHPAFIIDESTDEIEILVSVCGPGARLKENCRISTLVATHSEE